MINNNVEDHFDYLVDVLSNLKYDKITIITGSNASGKSLITSQATFEYRRLFNHALPHTSMRLRTENNPSMGALSSMCHDLSWLATSTSTIHSIKNVVDMVLTHDKKCLVIDEPEIGVGEELILGLIDYINDKIKIFKERNIGCIIVTHRREVVKLIDKDYFINLDGLSEEQWMNRGVVKRSLESFEKDADELFMFIRDKNKRPS